MTYDPAVPSASNFSGPPLSYKIDGVFPVPSAVPSASTFPRMMRVMVVERSSLQQLLNDNDLVLSKEKVESMDDGPQKCKKFLAYFGRYLFSPFDL